MRGFDPVVLQKQTIAYPAVAGLAKGQIFIDQFNRTTLNQTGVPSLYTTSVVGAGSVSIVGKGRLDLVTEAVALSEARCDLSEYTSSRVALFVDSSTIIEYDFIVRPNSAVANMDLFVGLVLQSLSLTVLPVAANIHMGVRMDASASGNYFFTESDGVTLTTTDTTVAAVNGTSVRLNLIWSGTNTATLTLFTGATLTTSSSTKAITALGSVATFMPVFFVEPDAIAAKTLTIPEWGVQTR